MLARIHWYIGRMGGKHYIRMARKLDQQKQKGVYMSLQKFSTYDILETLERAYEALIRSVPDDSLLGYESLEDAVKFHRVALIAVGDKIREYRKVIGSKN